MPQAKKQQFPTLEQIAAFYSGGNMKGPVTFDWKNTLGTTGIAGSGNIRLNPSLKAGWKTLQKYGPRSQNGMVLGAQILTTLIHEALHNRANQPGTGFATWDDEIQAGDLGVRLLPDAMQRFFGIPIDSKWGRKYTEMVLKQLAPVKQGGG